MIEQVGSIRQPIQRNVFEVVGNIRQGVARGNGSSRTRLYAVGGISTIISMGPNIAYTADIGVFIGNNSVSGQFRFIFETSLYPILIPKTKQLNNRNLNICQTNMISSCFYRNAVKIYVLSTHTTYT